MMSSSSRSRSACLFASVFLISPLPSAALGNGPIMGGYEKTVIGSSEAARLISSRELPVKISRRSGVETRLRIPAEFLVDLDRQGSLMSSSSSRTIIAGLALALAAGCFFVVCGHRLRNSNAAVTAAVLFFAGFCVFRGATADIPVPDQEPAARSGYQTIVLEVISEGDAVELILGRDAI